MFMINRINIDGKHGYVSIQRRTIDTVKGDKHVVKIDAWSLRVSIKSKLFVALVGDDAIRKGKIFHISYNCDGLAIEISARVERMTIFGGHSDVSFLQYKVVDDV